MKPDTTQPSEQADDLAAKLDRVSRWIDKFPVPTDGATAMMCLLRDVKDAITRQAAPEAPADVLNPCTSSGVAFNKSENVNINTAATTASASDGSIYESVARRADPVGHAEALAQIDEVLGRTPAPSRDAAPLTEARIIELAEAWAMTSYGYENDPRGHCIDFARALEKEIAAMSAATKQGEKP